VDALDRVYKPMCKAARREFAIKKSEQELSTVLQDARKVKSMASNYEKEVQRQRKAAGL
jgi:hypothetical protein